MNYERTELKQIRDYGYPIQNPQDALEIFENKIALYCGSTYAVATDCCTHALKLCLELLEAKKNITIPSHTYPSVPFMIHQRSQGFTFKDIKWKGSYALSPYPIIDSSLAFHPGCHTKNNFTCLSFQFKKRVPIGRGGAILLDDRDDYQWLKRATHDGRTPGTLWHNDHISMSGWHYYMTPEDAARGILLLDGIISGAFPDKGEILGGHERYPDLRTLPVFKDFSKHNVETNEQK